MSWPTDHLERVAAAARSASDGDAPRFTDLDRSIGIALAGLDRPVTADADADEQTVLAALERFDLECTGEDDHRDQQSVTAALAWLDRAEAALAERRPPRARGRRLWGTAVAAGMLLAFSAAALSFPAALRQVRQMFLGANAAEMMANEQAPQTVTAIAIERPRTRAAALQREPLHSSPRVLTKDDRESIASSDAASSQSSTTAGPDRRTTKDRRAELLSRAQRALARGHDQGALEAYQALVDRFPESREAHAARMSLARIHLARGEAKNALHHLDEFLERGGGALQEEARYLRTRALAGLGHRSDELKEIERFLVLHPQSIHADKLRARAKTLRP